MRHLSNSAIFVVIQIFKTPTVMLANLKKSKTNILIAIALLYCSTYGTGQTKLSENEKIKKILKEFYISYINESAKNPVSIQNLNKIKSNYCTKKMLLKIDSQALDYDPILNAQDCDMEWLKTLSVSRSKKSVFIVSFIDNYSKTKNSIKLVVIKVNDQYKIDDFIE